MLAELHIEQDRAKRDTGHCCGSLKESASHRIPCSPYICSVCLSYRGTCMQCNAWSPVRKAWHAEQAPSSTSRAAQAYPISSPQRAPVPSAPPMPQQRQQQMQQRGLLGSLMNLPIAALSSSFGLLFGVLGLSATAAAFIGSHILPAPWYSRIRGMACLLSGCCSK